MPGPGGERFAGGKAVGVSPSPSVMVPGITLAEGSHGASPLIGQNGQRAPPAELKREVYDLPMEFP